MAKETVEVMVEGGKATAGAALGGTLGPLKINIGDVVKAINEKTKDFKGMKVPVKVTVDTETKEFSLEVGTPPASQLIKKEINLDKASGEPNKNKYGVIAFEQLIKIAKMKQDSLIINELKSAVKTMIGTCQSAGILIDGKDAQEVLKEIDQGKYDEVIKSETTEIPEEKKPMLEELSKELAAKREQIKKEREAKKAAEEAKAAKKAATATAPTTPAKKTPAKKKK